MPSNAASSKRQRSVEETKRRIREAAASEFAEHGQHGTTMERIAARAGVNKERIYSYFGDKAALFRVVLHEELDALVEATPLEIGCVEDVGEFAGQLFDYQQAHPDVARLVHWEGLADSASPAHQGRRRRVHNQRVDALIAAQQKGIVDPSLDPGYFVFLILALASWWAAAPQTARVLTGADAATPGERERRRAAVVSAAQRLAEPAPLGP